MKKQTVNQYYFGIECPETYIRSLGDISIVCNAFKQMYREAYKLDALECHATLDEYLENLSIMRHSSNLKALALRIAKNQYVDIETFLKERKRYGF